mgnify:CR=1 FL=1
MQPILFIRFKTKIYNINVKNQAIAISATPGLPYYFLPYLKR